MKRGEDAGKNHSGIGELGTEALVALQLLSVPGYCLVIPPRSSVVHRGGNKLGQHHLRGDDMVYKYRKNT